MTKIPSVQSKKSWTHLPQKLNLKREVSQQETSASHSHSQGTQTEFSLHWPGEKDQQTNFPDPLKANFTKKEKEKASSRKRRNPLARSRTFPGAVPQKRQKLISDEDSFSSEQEVMDPPSPEIELESEVSQQETSASHSHSQGTQTEFSKYLLSAKIDTMLLKNEVALMRGDPNTTPKVVGSI